MLFYALLAGRKHQQSPTVLWAILISRPRHAAFAAFVKDLIDRRFQVLLLGLAQLVEDQR
jgi:hypothetical protein